MRQWNKRILVAIGVLCLFTLAVGVLFAVVSLYPRPVPPDLWTPSVLDYPETPDMNAWRVLQELTERLPHPQIADALEDWELLVDEIALAMPAPDLSDLAWQRLSVGAAAVIIGSSATAGIPQISRKIIDIYEKVLAYPELVDVDAFDGPSRIWYVRRLEHMHPAAWAQVVVLAEQKEWETVVSRLSRMLQQDHGWLLSARSPVSQVAALGCIRTDIALASILLPRMPESLARGLKTLIQSLNVSNFSIERVLAFEYLMYLNIPHVSGANTGWIGHRLIFNPALYKRDVNEWFAVYLPYLSGERPWPTDMMREHPLAARFDKRVHGFGWWFLNPVGKLCERVVFIDYSPFIFSGTKDYQRLKELMSSL